MHPIDNSYGEVFPNPNHIPSEVFEILQRGPLNSIVSEHPQAWYMLT